MHCKAQLQNSLSRTISRTATAALGLLTIVLALTLVLCPPAQAQTYTVIHNFTGGLDGGNPYAGLTMDAAGNLYGTTCGTPCVGGADNTGTVFRLSNQGAGWVLTTLHVFRGGSDGTRPAARVIIGPDGSLYGTTYDGAGSGCGGPGCGIVFNLKPAASVSPNIFGAWTETVLYRFSGGGDGANPEAEVIFDQAGNLYGTTTSGGKGFYGVAFQVGAFQWRLDGNRDESFQRQSRRGNPGQRLDLRSGW